MAAAADTVEAGAPRTGPTPTPCWRPCRGPSRTRRTLPVTGAWRPGDPLGQRQFMRMAVDRPFVLEGGGQLRDITIAYETWGELDADASNAVLVCHALTGDAHAAGRPARATRRRAGGTA